MSHSPFPDNGMNQPRLGRIQREVKWAVLCLAEQELRGGRISERAERLLPTLMRVMDMADSEMVNGVIPFGHGP